MAHTLFEVHLTERHVLTDASFTVVVCADGTRGLATTSAATASATTECFSE